MKNKIVAVLLIFIMIFAGGCGKSDVVSQTNSDHDTAKNSKNNSKVIVDNTGENDDVSENNNETNEPADTLADNTFQETQQTNQSNDTDSNSEQQPPASTTVITYETTVVPNHTHQFVLKESKAATCTTDGKETYVCSCGGSYVKVTSKTGHFYGNWVTVESSTCTHAGSRERVCSSCGKKVTESMGVDANNHINTKWIVTQEATYDSNGSKLLVCNDCGATINTESIPRLVFQHSATAMEQYMLDLVNEARINEGLSPLTFASNYYYFAQKRAQELTQSFNSQHNRPDGSPWYTVFGNAGYKTCGENICAIQPEDSYTSVQQLNSTQVKKMFDMFMNSPSHRQNIMNPNYTQLGIAFSYGICSDGGFKAYFCEQLFVTP